ncbi:MAG: signal peptide peptidase SppA [Thermodesulfobacteriota bacterium]
MRLIKKLLTLFGAATLIVLLAIILSLSYFGGRFHNDKVAVVQLNGLISDTTELTQSLESLGERKDVKAVVLRINSPGGAVAPSQELYDSIKRLDSKKAVVASMGSIAASGGYYAASAARRIIASPGTITGGIGVIVQFVSAEALLEKLGLKGYVIKSGKFKDSGSPLRSMRAEEKAILQALVNNVNTQFVKAVAEGRQMDVGIVRKLADGRIFTGEQAAKEGLVDELGGLNRAITLAAGLGGIKGKPYVMYVEEHFLDKWGQIISGNLRGGLSGLFPGLSLMYLTPGTSS